jgi:phage baseplate assembly protein W
MWMLDCVRHDIEYRCHWEALVDSIIDDIFMGYGKTIKNVADIRDRLGKLFITNIDSESIVMYMGARILERLSEPKKRANAFEIADKATEILARYDSRLKNATRYILHFEGLISSLAMIM